MVMHGLSSNATEERKNKMHIIDSKLPTRVFMLCFLPFPFSLVFLRGRKPALKLAIIRLHFRQERLPARLICRVASVHSEPQERALRGEQGAEA